MSKIRNNNILDTSRLNMGLWLLKVPQHLYIQIDKFEEGQEVGNMIIESIAKDGGDNSSSIKTSTRHIELHLSDPKNDQERLHQTDQVNEFTLEEQSKGLPLIALNYDDLGNRYSINGSIVKRVAAKPKVTDGYHDLVRKRTLDSKGSMSNKAVKLLTDQEIDKNNSSNAVHGFIPPPSNSQGKKKRGECRGSEGDPVDEPLDPKLLRKEFFDTIGSAEGNRMTLKDLLATLKQNGSIQGRPGVVSGEKEVKELLSEYTNFHRSGVYKNYYELKKEYCS